MKRPLILSLALSLMMFAACGGPQTFSPVQPSVTRASVRQAPERLTASGQISIEPGEHPTLRFQVTYRPEQFRTQALDCSRLASFQISVDGIGMTPLYADNASGENNTVAGGSCTITARVSAVPSGRSRIAHVIPYDSAGNPQMDLALSAAFDLTNPAENPKAVYLNFRSTPVGQMIQSLLDLNVPLLASKTDIVDLQTLVDQVIGTTFDPGNPSVVLEDFTLIHPLLVNQTAILSDLQNNGANVEALLNLPPDELLTLLDTYRLTPATVSGTVTGLEAGDVVTIRLLDPVTGAQANVSDTFSFSDVPPGTWQLVVEAPPGYQVISAPATVTVTAGQTLDNLEIEVAPSPPSSYSISRTSSTENSIGITWSEVPEATGYNVYINYQLVPGGPIPAGQNTTTLNGLSPSSAYHVEVKPIIAGTESDLIPGQNFATTNNWNSWTALANTSMHHILSLDSATFPDQVFFGTKVEGASLGGVWKCSGTTCGASAVLPGTTTGNVYAVAMDPENANYVYAGSDHGFFKSSDNGFSWEQKNNGLSGTALDIRAILVDPVNPNIVYIGTRGSGVYRSTDRGETWSEFNTGIDPAHREVYSLAIYNPPAPANPIIYAGTRVGGVYRIQDNTWQTINRGIFDDESESGTQYLGDVTVTALATHPNDPSLLYGGGLGQYGFQLGPFSVSWHVGVWKRLDNGTASADWSQIGNNTTNSFPTPNPFAAPTNLKNMQILALAVDVITPTTLYAATQNGIFKTTNGNVASPTWSNNYASGEFTGRVNAIGSSSARLYIGTSTGLYRAATATP